MENFDQKRDLKRKIGELVALRQEGGYWDFKKEWHKNKTKLLHDIICMANNLENRDAYIVIGVDEENDYSVVDVKSDPHRRNTQQIVDFLKDKKFAGGIRPVVHVEPLGFGGDTIDVIVVENSHNTPFFLVDQFDGVRANHIYTRVMDTNTPIEKSADINHVEYLWRKRFHIDDTPLDKFSHYLESSSKWDSIRDADMAYFCKQAPEFTIDCEADEGRSGYEYYLFGQINSTPHWWYITLKYHQTAIARFLGISLDGGRCFVVTPHRASELYDIGASNVAYFVQDDLRYRLLTFFHRNETAVEYAFDTFMRAILIFNSENERNSFFEYANRNRDLFYRLYAQQGDAGLPIFPKKQGLNMDEYKKDYRSALVLERMLRQFRSTEPRALLLEDAFHADV